MIIGDVIDLFLKKSKILYYDAYYLYNAKKIEDKRNLPIEKLLAEKESIRITCVEVGPP